MRVRKQTGSNWTEYIYFGSEVLAEKDQNNNWTDYIFAGGKRVAKAPGVASTSGTQYYHSDHLGSARLMTDASGNPVAASEGTFLPFGQEYAPTTAGNHYKPGSPANRFCLLGWKFTGKERDSESGLDYFGARYYASIMGRFTVPDSFVNDTYVADPQSWNLYMYTRNNPLRYIDPDGEKIQNTTNKKRKLSKAQLDKIVKDLRKKTGLKSLSFNKEGTLTYDKNEKATEGSSKLREQITGAIDSQTEVFSLADYSNDESVQFAETDEGTVNDNTGVSTYEVRIDFADFINAEDHSHSDAMAAFSLALNISHEINHKYPVFNPRDEGPGGVIDFVNGIQRQLGLPTRDLGSHRGSCAGGVCSIPFRDSNGQERLLKWQLEHTR